MNTTAAKVQKADQRGSVEVTKRDLSHYLGRAIKRLGITVKDIAFIWGTDESYVRHILADEKPLPEARFAELTAQPEIHAAMVLEQADDLGIVTGRKARLIGMLEMVVDYVREDERLNVPLRMAHMKEPR